MWSGSVLVLMEVCLALLSPPLSEMCQASVVFGLGKNQYITEVVESNSPEWSQEAVM